MGFLPATGGRVQFADTDVTTAAPIGAPCWVLGYVPQGARDFPRPHGPSTICAWDRQGNGAERDIIAADPRGTFLALKPLLDRGERGGGLCQCGEQQLLAIARCLAAKPRLVLLDEPTRGIQPSIIDESRRDPCGGGGREEAVSP